MRKLGLLLALVALVALGSVALAAPAKPRTFGAHLSGKQEVPAVATKGQGQFSMRLSKDGTKLHFRLNVANLQNVTAAHLHNAAKGVNGPVVATLFTGAPTDVEERALLAKGTLADADLVGMTVAELVQKIKAGEIYVNVHTTENPAGAIRGQVRALPPATP